MLRLEFIMRTRGITQTSLALQTGVARTTISRVLRGDLPPYPKYRRLFAEAINWKGDPAALFEEIEGL